MSYTKPALNAVNFAIVVYSKPDISARANVLNAYTKPSLSAVNFALASYTLPIFNRVNFELGNAGALAISLDALGLTAAGTVASSSITGELTATLGDLTLSANDLIALDTSGWYPAEQETRRVRKEDEEAILLAMMELVL